MKRIFSGILLDILSTIALLFFLVLPAVMPIKDVPGLEPTLQGLLCERGETIEVERTSYSRRPGQMSYSANYYCVRETGARRDVSGRMILFGLIGFTVPLVIGILLIVSGSMSMKSKQKRSVSIDPNIASVLEGFGISIDQQPTSFQSMTIDARGQGSLTDRLKALKSAYDQGLITEEEYESKRKEILHEM